MASYPGAIANLNNPAGTDYMSDPATLHATQHGNANDEIEAIQTELGLNPRGVSASVAARLNALDTTISALVPPGVMFNWAGAAAPAGYLLCYGQVVSRTTYAALFANIGTLHNTGGEAGTDFRLPDGRGRTMVGLDNMGGTDAGRLSSANTVGVVGGAESVVLTTTHLPAHTHAIDHGHADTIAITSMTGNSGNNNVDHTHTVPDHSHGAYTYGGNGAHQHGVLATPRSIYTPGSNSAGMYAADYTYNTSVAGGHEHNVGVNGSGAIGTTGVSANHVHDIGHGHAKSGSVTNMTGASGSAGTGTGFSLMQPYLTTNIIIKY